MGLIEEPGGAAAAAGAEPLPKAADAPAIRRPAEGEPLATVVLATSGVDPSVLNVVRHVRSQTLADRIEFIAIAETLQDAEALIALPEGATETLMSTRAVATGTPVTNIDAEAARGIALASAPVTCVVEDHAYPSPDWVERLLAAYETPEQVGAAGSCVRNANPGAALSRVNLLIAYGNWMPPLAGQDLTPSGHNVSYRTDAVKPYAESLADRISRAGTIMSDLQARGFAVKVVPEATVHHANPSRALNSAKLRFDGGRLFGAAKAEEARWSRPKRWAYFAMSPAILGFRFVDMKPKVPLAGRSGYPALFAGLALDALGQGVGFAFGAGGAKKRLEDFELGRLRHLRPADRRLLTSEDLAFEHGR